MLMLYIRMISLVRRNRLHGEADFILENNQTKLAGLVPKHVCG